MSDEVKEAVEEIAEETRKGFDLSARLKNRPMRTKTVTVYLNEILGEKLGDARDAYDGNVNLGRRVRIGILGEIDALEPVVKEGKALLDRPEAHTDERIADVKKLLEETEPRLEKLRAEADELREQMKSDSITFHLQAVPPIILKDCRRKARKALDIKSKDVPEKLQDAYDDEFVVQVLIASVTSYTDGDTGETVTGIEHSVAGDLLDFLPAGEWSRLDGALSDLQFRNVIAEQVADDADF